MNDNRAARVSWTPLTLHQARGFPVYFVTYQPSSQVGRVTRAVNAVNTTNSSVLIGGLDPATEYTFSVDVGTAGGRGTLGPGQCIPIPCIYSSFIQVHNLCMCISDEHTYMSLCGKV